MEHFLERKSDRIVNEFNNYLQICVRYQHAGLSLSSVHTTRGSGREQKLGKSRDFHKASLMMDQQKQLQKS